MTRFRPSDAQKLTFDYVLSVTEDQRLQGDGSYLVVCPAHSDRGPSLHVTEGPNGYAVLNCFAGCTYPRLVAALLGASEAVPTPVPSPIKSSSNGSSTQPTSLAWLAKYTNLSQEFLKSQALEFSHPNEIGYKFTDTHAVKWRQVGGKKYHWDHNGNEAPPLWPTLPEKLDPVIFLTAGETDCLCLRACEVEAFALTKGEATQLQPALFTQLKARGVKEIVYSPDVDREGAKGALQLQETVERAGLDFTPLDLTEHLDLTKGEKDVRGLTIRVGVQKLHDLLEADYLQGPTFRSELGDDSLQGVSTHVPWIVMPLLAKGGTTLFSAPAKSGKTTLLLKIIKAMEKGGTVLRYRVNPGKVMFWTENSKMVLAQKTAVHLLPPNPHWFVIYRDEETLLGKTFEEALQIILRESKRRQCDLLVIDTLTGLGMVEDENDAAALYRLLVPINRLAHKYGIGIAMIHHLGKSGSERGSSVLLSEPDILVRLEGEYRDPRVLKIKNNMLVTQPDDLKFTMDAQGTYSLVSTADENADVLDLFSTASLLTLKDAWEGAGETWSDKARQALSRRVKDLVDQGLLHEVLSSGRPALYQKVMQVSLNPV